MSIKAVRCLGFAYKEDLAVFATYDGKSHPAHKLLLAPANFAAIETNLIFTGLGLRCHGLMTVISILCSSNTEQLGDQPCGPICVDSSKLFECQVRVFELISVAVAKIRIVVMYLLRWRSDG